jgi:type IV pilus assembly protein PilB
LIDAISDRLAIPRLSLDAMVIDPAVIQRVPVDLARRYTLVPVFSIGSTITLAMADPLNIIAIEEIKYRTGCEIKRAVASISEIKKAIDDYYSVADSIVTFHRRSGYGYTGHQAGQSDYLQSGQRSGQ